MVYVNPMTDDIFKVRVGTVKDTWTKPRERVEAREGRGFGWGGVEWWGEYAGNCS